MFTLGLQILTQLSMMSKLVVECRDRDSNSNSYTYVCEFLMTIGIPSIKNYSHSMTDLKLIL